MHARTRPRILLAALLAATFVPTSIAQTPPLLQRDDVGPGRGPRVPFVEARWDFWWYLNEDTYVAARRDRLRALAAAEGKSVEEPALLDAVEIDRTAKTLLDQLDAPGSGDPRLRAALVVAAAKSGRAALRRNLDAALADAALEVRTAAALALGILGDHGAATTLESLVANEKQDGDVRFHAAVGLGILDRFAAAAERDAALPAKDDAAPIAGDDPAPNAPDGDEADAPADPLASAERFAVHGKAVTSLAWLPDGSALVSAAGEPGAAVTNLAAGSTTRRHETAPVHAVAVAPSGDLAAFSLDDGSIALFSLAATRVRSTLRGAGKDAPLAFDPERGERLATLLDDGAAAVFTTGSGRRIARFARHEGGATSLAWAPDAQRVASGGADGAVRLWSARSGAEFERFAGHAGDVRAVAFAPGGGAIASGGADGLVRLWNLGDADHRVLGAAGSPITALAWSPDNAYLAAAAEDGFLRVFAAGEADAEPETLDLAVDGGATALAWEPSGARLAIGTKAGALLLVATAGAARVEEGDGGDGADEAPGATPASRALARLLQPKRFQGLASQAQRGVAIGTGFAEYAGPLRQALRERLTARREDPALVRAHFAVSYGRLATSAAARAGAIAEEDLAFLFRLLEDDDTQVRRSAALALGGLLAGTGDGEPAAKLARRIEDEPDVLAQDYLVIALGRTGGRLALGRLAERAGDEGTRVRFPSGTGIAPLPRVRLGKASRQPFAALALGIGGAFGVFEWLAHGFEDESDQVAQAALAVSLGLFGDARAGSSLARELDKTSDPFRRGWIALALGLVGETRAAPRIRELLRDEHDGELLPRLALALDLMGDPQLKAVLRERFDRKVFSPDTERALLYSLGRFGDRDDLARLLAIATDHSETGAVREYAAIAAGDLIARSRGIDGGGRVLGFVLADANYTADPTLFATLFAVL